MPELPEVATVVSDLEKKIVGETIALVWTDWPKMIKDPKAQSKHRVSQKAVRVFMAELPGKKVLSVDRVAKNIVINLSGGHTMLVHQKMTGHLLVGKWEVVKNKVRPISPPEVVTDPYNGYIHLLLTFRSGKMLGLSDVRKFAKVLFGPREVIAALPELLELGPDALSPDLRLKEFTTIIQSQRRVIKTTLLDPRVLAGIGNIYSDEMLFQARIHPMRRANSLSKEECARLFKAMSQILKKAVRLRGTSTTDFRDTAGKRGGYTDKRLVYGKDKLPCPRCKVKIKRIMIGGRSARFCPECQVLG